MGDLVREKDQQIGSLQEFIQQVITERDAWKKEAKSLETKVSRLEEENAALHREKTEWRE